MTYKIDDRPSVAPAKADMPPRGIRTDVRPKRPLTRPARATARPLPVAATGPGEHNLQPVADLQRRTSRIPSDNDILSSVMQQIGKEQPVVASPIPTPAPTPALADTSTPPDISNAGAINWILPGFDRRCRVSTIFGELPIEALRLRDQVKTLSGAYRQVEWIDEIRLDADFMARHPEAHPIQLRARSLGGAQPKRNILVSPGQVLHATGLIGNINSGPAARFEGYPSIARLNQTEITYYRFHCGESETVCIEGAWFCVSP